MSEENVEIKSSDIAPTAEANAGTTKPDDNGEVTTDEANAGGFDFDGFMSSLGEEDKQMLEKNGVKDVDVLMKSYRGLLGLRGKNALVKPADDASDDDKNQYRDNLMKELGRPEDGKYNFDMPDNVTDDMVSQEFIDGLAGVAHKSGMNGEGFQDLINHIYSAYATQMKTIQEEIKERLGEDSISDNSSTANITRDSLETQISELQKKAMEAQKNNDYAGAAKLQSEYQQLIGQKLNLKTG